MELPVGPNPLSAVPAQTRASPCKPTAVLPLRRSTAFCHARCASCCCSDQSCAQRASQLKRRETTSGAPQNEALLNDRAVFDILAAFWKPTMAKYAPDTSLR